MTQNKIAVIGYGYVGKAMTELLTNRWQFDTLIMKLLWVPLPPTSSLPTTGASFFSIQLLTNQNNHPSSYLGSF